MDELFISLIDGVIESTREWGSLAGKFAEKLKASAGARINWRNILSGFRASILSSSRKSPLSVQAENLKEFQSYNLYLSVF